MTKLLIDNVNYLKFPTEEFYRISEKKYFDSEIEKLNIGNGIEDIYINVNLKFADRDRQCNAGVELWRKVILKNYDCSKNRLKFHFYSFLTREKCVKNSFGRDVVLFYDELVEFLRLPLYIESKNIKSIDINEFDKIRPATFSDLSYSSELLLSGWGICVFDDNKNELSFECSLKSYEAKKINNANKKIVLIDDKIKEWERIFKIIFKEDIHYFQIGGENDILLKEIKCEKYYNKYSNYIEKLFKDKIIKESDFILLDMFYNSVGEYHESDKRLDENSISNIIGFKLLKYFSNKFPYIPVVMFTTSTKVWNYKHFFKSGAIDWWTKISKSIISDNQTAKDAYNEFQSIVIKYLNEPFNKFKDVWFNIKSSEKSILKVNPKYQEKGRYKVKLTDEDQKKIKILLDKSFYFMKYIDKSADKYYIASAIVEQLGNIIEVIYKQWERKKMKGLNKYFEALWYLRNHASHSTYTEIDIYDVILSFILIKYGIYNINNPTKFNTLVTFDKTTPELIMKYKLYFIYKSLLSFINDEEIVAICKYKMFYSLKSDDEVITAIKEDEPSKIFIKEDMKIKIDPRFCGKRKEILNSYVAESDNNKI